MRSLAWVTEARVSGKALDGSAMTNLGRLTSSATFWNNEMQESVSLIRSDFGLHSAPKSFGLFQDTFGIVQNTLINHAGICL